MKNITVFSSFLKNHNVRRVAFIALIMATLFVPAIISNSSTAWLTSIRQSFDLSIITTISSIVAAFVVFIFLLEVKMNVSLKILLALLSLVPSLSLIIASALFLAQLQHGNDFKPTLTERLKNHFLILIGYLSIYSFIFGLTGLIFFIGYGEKISDSIRVAVSTLLLYAIYNRDIKLGRFDLFIYVIIAIIFTALLGL